MNAEPTALAPIATMLAHQLKIQVGVASENNTTTFWLSCPAA